MKMVGIFLILIDLIAILKENISTGKHALFCLILAAVVSVCSNLSMRALYPENIARIQLRESVGLPSGDLIPWPFTIMNLISVISGIAFIVLSIMTTYKFFYN